MNHTTKMSLNNFMFHSVDMKLKINNQQPNNQTSLNIAFGNTKRKIVLHNHENIF